MTTGLPAFLGNNTLSVLALFSYQTRHFDNGSARCQYVEWGGRAGEAPLNLVETKRIDLAKYRNFCNTGS